MTTYRQLARHLRGSGIRAHRSVPELADNVRARALSYDGRRIGSTFCDRHALRKARLHCWLQGNAFS